METDQSEQLDTLLNQSAYVFNRNHEAEETDTLMTSKRDSWSPPLLDNQDTQTAKVIAEKRILIWLQENMDLKHR